MQGNCARCGRKVRSEENWLRAHFVGEHRGVSLGLCHRAPEGTRPARRRRDDVERRRTQTLKQLKKCSAPGL
jgi:hypothetical protein